MAGCSGGTHVYMGQRLTFAKLSAGTALIRACPGSFQTLLVSIPRAHGLWLAWEELKAEQNGADTVTQPQHKRRSCM